MCEIIQVVTRLPSPTTFLSLSGEKVESFSKTDMIEVISQKGNKYKLPIGNARYNIEEVLSGSGKILAVIDTEKWEVKEIYIEPTTSIDEEKEKYGDIYDLGGDY